MSVTTQGPEHRKLTTAPTRRRIVALKSLVSLSPEPLFAVSKRHCVGVFGHFGNENLGDESIIAALFSNLRSRIRQAEFIAFSLRPDDTTKRHGVAAYPIRRISPNKCSDVSTSAEANHGDHSTFSTATRAQLEYVKRRVKRHPLLSQPLRAALQFIRLFATCVREVAFLAKSFWRLRNLDLLIVAGSNQFLDNFGGPWGFPYTLLKWTVLAKLAGVEVLFLNVGAGPLNHPLSNAMVRYAIKLSDYLSVRDFQSRRLLESNGIYEGATVYPDLAFALPPRPRGNTATRDELADSPMIVGINPMPIYDRRYWCDANPAEYDQYIEQLVTFSTRSLRDNCSLVFWSTQTRDQDVITDVVSGIDRELGCRFDDRLRVVQPISVESLLKTIESCDIAVATRFHGVVLSLFCARPVLAICYHPKMQDLMLAAGQGEYAVPFDGLDSTDLFERFTRLRRSQQQATVEIRQRRKEFVERLQMQFDHLFGPMCTHADEFDRQAFYAFSETAHR